MPTSKSLNLKPFTNETAEALEAEAQEYFNFSKEPYSPKDRPLALGFYNDAPGGIGGGNRAILWFDEEKELLEVLANYLLVANPGPSDTDYEGISKKLAAIVTEYWQETAEKEDAIQTINVLAKKCFQIEWWGTRDALLFGDEEFPARTRAWWRCCENSSDVSPLKPGELADFLEYLECGYMC